MDAPPLQVLLCDVTLREGDQTPGVRLSLDDKLRIADILNAAGVAQIQLNHMTYPAIREEARVLMHPCGIPLSGAGHHPQ